MYVPIPIAHPQIQKQLFNGVEKDCVAVDIEGEEYIECEKASNKFWGNSKPGAYGAGLGATQDDPHKPARIGLLGQMAFGKLMNEPVDTEYRRGGDKQDNLIGEYKFDVKCAMTNYNKAFIYHTNEWGKRIPLDKDVYVCAYVESEDRTMKKARIIMVGFVLKEYVSNCLIQKGPKGNGHKNYVVPFSKVKSIIGLRDIIFKTHKCSF